MERQRAEAELAAPEGQGIRLLAFGLCSEKTYWNFTHRESGFPLL